MELTLKHSFIDYLLFYVPLKNISLIWTRHFCRWRAAKFRPMLGAQDFWAGGDSYHATPAVTRGLGFCHPKGRPIQLPPTTHKGMWRIYSNLDAHGSLFSRPLRHTRGCKSYLYLFSFLLMMDVTYTTGYANKMAWIWASTSENKANSDLLICQRWGSDALGE
jgi:hypothetical protein